MTQIKIPKVQIPKKGIAERIMNVILYGDPKGFGYKPTGREIFEQAQKKKHEQI